MKLHPAPLIPDLQLFSWCPFPCSWFGVTKGVMKASVKMDVNSVDRRSWRRPDWASTGRRRPHWRFLLVGIDHTDVFITGRHWPDWGFQLVDVDHSDVFYWSTVDVRLTFSSRPWLSRSRTYTKYSKHEAFAKPKHCSSDGRAGASNLKHWNEG